MEIKQFALNLITPEMAATIIRGNILNHNSPTNPEKIERYAQLMREGKWHQGTELLLVKMHGRYHMPTNRHRMFAIVKSGIPQEFFTYVIYTKNINTYLNDLAVQLPPMIKKVHLDPKGISFDAFCAAYKLKKNNIAGAFGNRARQLRRKHK